MKTLMFHSRSPKSTSTEKEAREKYAVLLKPKWFLETCRISIKLSKHEFLGWKGETLKYLFAVTKLHFSIFRSFNEISCSDIHTNACFIHNVMNMLVHFKCVETVKSQEEPSDISATRPHSVRILFISCSDPNPSPSALKSQTCFTTIPVEW